MGRNAGGTYSLPAGNPVVTGTTITSSWANTTLSDLATEMTDSLSRSGKGGMLAGKQLSIDAGTVAAPGLVCGTDIASGIYRVGLNDIGLTINGVKVMEWTSAGPIASILQNTAANASFSLLGNRNAADAGADVVSNSTATRTAGNLHEFQNNTVAKLDVDFSGQLKWPSGPASTATTPSPSAVTAPTPNANWTATNGLGFWKDAMNIVRLRGGATPAGGAGATVFTVPAGFRPANSRIWLISQGISTTPAVLSVGAGGDFVMTVFVIGNGTVNFDTVSYLAEQ